MNFRSQYELYLCLLPVFNVKARISRYYGYFDIKNQDIWSYLIANKWKKSKDLCLSEIVNDIITFNVYELKGKKIYE